jgi:hypothetical protein
MMMYFGCVLNQNEQKKEKEQRRSLPAPWDWLVVSDCNSKICRMALSSTIFRDNSNCFWLCCARFFWPASFSSGSLF